MARKYLRSRNGIVSAITTDNLQLEKPLLNENYDIEVHNRNMDKIDGAIQEVKGKIDGLELIASKVTMSDGSTVEDAITNLQVELNGNVSTLENNINAIREVL
ncbi:MAG: hypothetical protein IJH55_00085 [Romboutsia sp.]|nr:hypothetical protein [Romboutsia sp.]